MAGNITRVFENRMNLQDEESKTKSIMLKVIHVKTRPVGLFHKACDIENRMIQFEKITLNEKPRSELAKTYNHKITKHVTYKSRNVFPRLLVREIKTRNMQNQKYATYSAVISCAPFKEIKRQK